MSGYILSVDDHNRWSVFDTQSALGTFDTWAEADALRRSLSADRPKEETGHVWTPKSGGY